MSVNTTGIRFLYLFSLGQYDLSNPGSNIISVTDTATGDFDKSHLTTNPLREVWRSADVSGWKEIVIQANDLTNPLDTFAILNHNFTPDAIVQLLASPSLSFAGAPINVTLTWNEKHMVYLNDLGSAYRYFKLRVLDTTNTCGFIEIGKIIGGKSLTVTNNEDITDDVTITPTDMAYQMDTEGFFRASNERVKVDSLAVKFSSLKTYAPDDGNYKALKSFLYYVGKTIPFLTILDPEEPGFQIQWGLLDSMPAFTYGINRYADIPITIDEVY